MKDRLLTLALAVAAFALFYVLLGPGPSPPQERPTRPITTEPGPNGYLALMRWLETTGLRPISFRERYTRLPAAGAPATGNLLISTAPHLYPVRDSEIAPLRDWISAGNTLFVVAGLSDTPEWSMGEGLDPAFMTHMYAMTGLSFEQHQDAPGELVESENGEPGAAQPGAGTGRPTLAEAMNALERVAEPLKFEMTPAGPHPLLAGVSSVAALSEYPTAKWHVSSTTSSLVLSLAHDPATQVPVLWLVRYGQGQIIVSAYGSVLTNKLIGTADNAQLLSNVVTWSLAQEGRILIDDAHQGLVAFYDPDAFFGDRRLHWSVIWLIGLWLVFVLGPQRLRMAAARWNPRDITTFVRASGGFMARVLEPAAAAQQLFANFFNDVRRQVGLPQSGAPLWDWIEQRPAVAPDDVEQLRRLHGEALQGRRVDLLKLQNTLLRIRTQLQ
jgi:hypothetical protein